MEFLKSFLFTLTSNKSSNIPTYPESPALIPSSHNDFVLETNGQWTYHCQRNRQAETPKWKRHSLVLNKWKKDYKKKKRIATDAEMLRHHRNRKISANSNPQASTNNFGSQINQNFKV